MASETPNIGLVKQEGTEYGDYEVTNENLDKIDEEMGKRGKTVNGEGPDPNGNYQVDEVPFARQIVTDDAQQMSGEFIFRTTGGDASISDGPAKLVSIFGRSRHTGIVEESIRMTVNAVEREVGEDPITATIDRDTFVAYVSSSGTTTLTYTNAWSANPALYGVTVEGDPVSGDQIVIVYVKENRGLITNSNPEWYISTGWNLYYNLRDYIPVVKYSDQYGFLIGGTYTKLEYSATIQGQKTTITPAGGYFTIPGDGYLWVTGGDTTTTYVMMTWSDWGEGYEGDWKPHEESGFDLAQIMANFPYGMIQVEGIADEINFGMGKAISRIERMAYTAENVAIAKASGRPWDADENYIYIARANEVSYDISITGDYTANDHGMEYIYGTPVAPYVQTVYGQNLVDKLRTDVLTISNQTLSSAQKAQVQQNIGVPSTSVTDAINSKIATSNFMVVASLDSLKSNLLSFVQDMNERDVKNISIITQWTDNVFSNGDYYIGPLNINSKGPSYVYFSCVLKGLFGKDLIIITYTNGAWTFENLNKNIAQLGERVGGTKNAVNCPNGGVSTTIGSITLNKGRWIVFVNGWSPLGDVQERATQISVSDTFGCATIPFRLFSMSGLVHINSDNTVLNLNVTNWEREEKTSETTYNFYAARVGF